MATQAQEHLLAWLRDAHAMEEQAETLLSSQISRLKHYPDLRGKLEEHLEETRRQAQAGRRLHPAPRWRQFRGQGCHGQDGQLDGRHAGAQA